MSSLKDTAASLEGTQREKVRAAVLIAWADASVASAAFFPKLKPSIWKKMRRNSENSTCDIAFGKSSEIPGIVEETRQKVRLQIMTSMGGGRWPLFHASVYSSFLKTSIEHIMRELYVGMQKIYSEFIYKILDADKKWGYRYDTKKREESEGLTRVVEADGVGGTIS